MNNILYIIGMPEGPVKIGFTTNLQTRLYAILNACPFEAKVLACFEAGPRTPDFEKIVHFSLRNSKMRGEWFDVNLAGARSAILRAATATNFALRETVYEAAERGRPMIPGKVYSREDWDAVESPELTEEELATARPMQKAMPELHAAITETIRKRGPAKVKEAISIRLDQDLVVKLRASGPGWQSRVNDALRDWVSRTAA